MFAEGCADWMLGNVWRDFDAADQEIQYQYYGIAAVLIQLCVEKAVVAEAAEASAKSNTVAAEAASAVAAAVSTSTLSLLLPLLGHADASLVSS